MENLPNDPIHNQYFNEGLDYVAHLIETGKGAHEKNPKKFIETLLTLIESAKKPVDFKQEFFDAIKNDPYMEAGIKSYWLGVGKRSGSHT